jgi:ATP-binding cassette subfamily B protein
MKKTNKKKSDTSVKRTFSIYMREILNQKKYSIAALLLPGIGNVFVFYVPSLTIAKMIRDFNGIMPSMEQALPYIVFLGCAWMFGEVIWRLALIMLNRTDSKGMQNLYQKGLDDLLDRDMDFFNDNFAGSITKKVVGFGKNFENFVDTISINIVGNLIPLLFVCVILWKISPILVLSLLAIIVLGFFALLPFIRRRQKLTSDREKDGNLMTGHVADVIGNISAVQIFANEKRESDRHKFLVSKYMKSSLKSLDYSVTRLDMIVAPAYVLTNVIGLIIAISFTNNATSLASVFVTFSYFAQATRIFFEFNRTYRNIESSLTDAAQFVDLTHDEPSIKNLEGAKKLDLSGGEISFKSVSFGYSGDKKNIFDNLNLDIKPGEKIALVGHSGGGKTTIVKLLLRFFDINKGSIEMDGQDISKCTLKSLRENISYVPQDPAMFHRSIADNIKYGKLDATDEEVIEAAKSAHAHEFISSLSSGYNTLVGERGIKLSGGQRQRIAIARAIIKSPPIILLDEATSALDSESEMLIQDALQNLMKNRTAIIIAHRLSTIQKVDRIIVIEKGKIKEQGTHAELLKLKGSYANLWKHQSGGFV